MLARARAAVATRGTAASRATATAGTTLSPAAALAGGLLLDWLRRNEFGTLADECGHRIRPRRHRHRGHRDLGLAQQGGDVAPLIRQAHGDHVTGTARAGRSARPVQVGLVLVGRVDVDDEFDVVDVHPAGRDVGGDQHADVTGTEGPEVPITLRLTEIAVQVDGGDAVLGELAGELLGLMLGAHEQDSTPGAGGEFGDECGLVARGDLEDVVGHRGNRRVGLVDRMHGGVVQESARELVDAVVEGGREQHPLTVGRGGGQDAGDDGQEPEVSHVVGLVDHGDLDVVEGDDALTHEVVEAARAGDDDVDATTEGLLLPGLLHTTEDGGHTQADGLGERFDDASDLCGQLARGREDQAGGRARLAGHLHLGQPGDERDREGQGLSGAGLAAAEDVLALQGVTEGVLLDRECFGFTFGGKNFHQFCGHAEGFECGHVLLSA